MRVFVTGATGFVGRAICQRLQSSCDVIGSARRAPSQPEGPFETVLHDWNHSFAAAPLHPSDVFVHCAFAGRLTTDELASNERMAWNAVMSAREMKAERVIVISSGSIYGEQEGAITEETPIPEWPESMAYPRSCKRVESIFYQNIGEASLRILRVFYPYGPGQAYERLIPRLAETLGKGDPIPLRPDRREPRNLERAGRPVINPIYIEDLAEAVNRLIRDDRSPLGRVFLNLGGPERLSIRELALKISKQLDLPCGFQVDPEASPALDFYASNQYFQALTGYSPATDLEEGLQLTFKGSNLNL